jgi:hypothetical protein
MMDIMRQADRIVDPLTGKLLDERPGFDPRLLPSAETPIAPWVEQLIVQTVNDAIALNLPLIDAMERVVGALESFGVVLSVDDLRSLAGASVLQPV